LRSAKEDIPVEVVEKLVLPVASSIAGAIAGSLLKDGFPYLLARFLGGWFPGDAKFRGRWQTTYEYDRDGRKTDDPVLFVKQFRRWIRATGTSTKDKSQFVVRAKLTESGVITGDWEEWTPAGRYYYGSFQLNVSPEFSTMKGQWVGIGKDRRVKNGVWDWEKKPAERGAAPDPARS
jgi:hypothetical protein